MQLGTTTLNGYRAQHAHASKDRRHSLNDDLLPEQSCAMTGTWAQAPT